MLCLITGGLGSGKTLFTTIMAYSNASILKYSNYNLFLSNVEKFVVNDFLDEKYKN